MKEGWDGIALPKGDGKLPKGDGRLPKGNTNELG